MSYNNTLTIPKHHQYVAGNAVRVHFPFEPYETQKRYMDAIIVALMKSQNALLESPTGTGKTLSLLCSTLAWFQNHCPKPSPMVYYASRTHIQLAQGAKEMKRTAYNRIPAVVLGGRAQMCLNDDVRAQAVGSEHLINRACRNALAKNACQYYSNYEQKLETANVDSVNDIEDLITFGRKALCCPYYASKKLAEAKASVVFTPYNYLLNTQLRKALQLKLEKAVIIFDEAHNIEDAFKECVSGSFSSTCLNSILLCNRKLPEKINTALLANKGISRFGYEPKTNGIVDELKQQKQDKKAKEPKINPIEELAAKLTTEKLQAVSEFCRLLSNQLTLFKSGPIKVEDFYQALDICGCNYTTSTMFLETLESAMSFLQMAGVQNVNEVDRFVTGMSNLFDSISLFYPQSCSNYENFKQVELRLIKFYKVYLEISEEPNKTTSYKVYFWCLNPALGLAQMIDSSCVEGVRSLIITSGTLAPMSGLVTELGTEFGQIKDFPHVINQSQLKIAILKESPDGKSLESTRVFTDKIEYPDILGSSMLPLFKMLPFGTIVFFQSYTLMDRVIKAWKAKGQILERMKKVTKVYVESKTQAEFVSNLTNFKRDIDSKSKAVFFGVCRGKLSEGTNLEGNYCRTVILTGLPFPRINDPKVVFTREYHAKNGNQIFNAGDAWYKLQMQRALNQTIGRVIRSNSDFGLLLLCDPRFARCKASLSKWVQNFFPSEATNFRRIEQEIKDFFAVHGVVVQDSLSQDVGTFQLDLARKDDTTNLNGAQPSVISSTIKKNIDNRQARMIASYTVSSETYKELVDRRKNDDMRELTIATKKPRTSIEVFDSLFSTPFRQIEIQSQEKQNYSILEQLNNKLKYTICDICKNPPTGVFFRTHCACARAGCKKCLSCLHGKVCPKCNITLDRSKFRPCFFNSVKKPQN